MTAKAKRVRFTAGEVRFTLPDVELVSANTLPDVELVSAKVHEAWMANKLALGVTTRQAEDGEELMVPYEQLSEKAKSLDRSSVKAVYEAIQNLSSFDQPGHPNNPIAKVLDAK